MPATASGFRATRNGKSGPLVVHRVPIFVETEKRVTRQVDGKPVVAMHQFDGDWIEKAVAQMQAKEAEGYLPPLHVQHHGEGKEVVAAGHFRVVGTEEITFEGRPRKAVMADLVITNPQVEADVKAMRFPYRSVEIHKLDTPAIDSLALLDAEVPHCRLPMLTVAEEAEATFRAHGMTVFAAGKGAAVQFAFGGDGGQDDQKEASDGGEQEGAGAGPGQKQPEDGEQGDGEQDAKASTPSAKAIVDAIKNGSISVADLQAIVQAIQERSGSASGGDDQQQEAAAPVPVPGQQMSGDVREATNMTTKTETKTPEGEQKTTMAADSETAVKMAALQGELEGLKAKLAERDENDKRRQDVATAMQKLAGRPLGADLEQRLVTFRAEYGQAAFSAFVDHMAKAVGVSPRPTSAGERFLADSAKPPAVAMKYQAQGPDAIDKAARLAAEWTQMRRNMSQERYVQIQMAANPLNPDASEVA